MFMLAHTDGYESAKSSFAKAAAPTGFPSALGIVGNPCVESTVRPVTLVQLDRSPDVKSSLKITVATVTGSETGLIALGLLAPSTASTV